MLTNEIKQELEKYYKTLKIDERRYLWSLYQCELVKKAQKARITKRNEYLDKIIKYLTKHDFITNVQIEELLGVKHSSAVRYMDQLEACGKVVQIGKIGRGVKYKLVKNSVGFSNPI